MLLDKVLLCPMGRGKSVKRILKNDGFNLFVTTLLWACLHAQQHFSIYLVKIIFRGRHCHVNSSVYTHLNQNKIIVGTCNNHIRTCNMSILFGLLRHVKTLTTVNTTNSFFVVLSALSAVCNTHSPLQLLQCVKQPLLAIYLPFFDSIWQNTPFPKQTVAKWDKLMTLCSLIIMYPEINKKNTMGTNIFCGYGGVADEVSKAYGFSDIQPICCIFWEKVTYFTAWKFWGSARRDHLVWTFAQRQLVNVSLHLMSHSFDSNFTAPRWKLTAPALRGLFSKCDNKKPLCYLDLKKWDLIKKDSCWGGWPDSLFVQRKEFCCQGLVSFLWKRRMNMLWVETNTLRID